MDASHRRFPFLTALAELTAVDCPQAVRLALQGNPLGSFVRQLTLQRLGDLLATPARPVDFRCILLAIGLLLRPLLGNGQPRFGKGLPLPLPSARAHRDPVAVLWLYLASAFLRHTGCELQLHRGRTGQAGQAAHPDHRAYPQLRQPSGQRRAEPGARRRRQGLSGRPGRAGGTHDGAGSRPRPPGRRQRHRGRAGQEPPHRISGPGLAVAARWPCQGEGID